MTQKNSKLVDQYLHEVLTPIAPASLRGDIAHEIASHINENIQVGMEYGLSEEKATLVAIEKMGTPAELGKRLADIHRPRLNWGVIGPTAGLIAVGFLAMYSIGRFSSQLIFGLMGMVLAGLLTFTDFSKLKRFAPALYVLSLVGVVLAMVFGTRYFGQPYLFIGPVRIKIMDATPFLFVVGLGGMITRDRWNERRSSALLLIAMTLPQIMFFATNSLPSLVLFLVAAVALMHASGAKHWQTSIIGFTGIVLLILMNGSDSFVSASNSLANRAAESHTDYVLSYLVPLRTRNSQSPEELTETNFSSNSLRNPKNLIPVNPLR
jgi:rod shape determining protein RodA